MVLASTKTRSQVAEALLQLRGGEFRLDPYYSCLRAIYDGSYRNMLLLTSRQVGKSTTLATFAISESISIPHFSTLFLSPTAEQSHKFSSQRVGKIIEYSPFLQSYFVGPKGSERVLLRSFSNGSEINFSYAMDSGDRCRGISADRVSFDEVQDILIDAVGAVVKESLRESQYRFKTYCGTPKSTENGIESLWQDSTQTEWVIPCTACNKENIVRSEKSFGPGGPICLSCKVLLDPRKGRWIDMRPGKDLKGFHISRAMMPRSVPSCWKEGTPEHKNASESWDEIWQDLTGRRAIALSTFRNEVIGVSDEKGRRIISIEDLRAACTGPAIKQRPDNMTNAKGINRIVAGLDFSGGGSNGASKTVLTVLGLLPGGKYRLLWFKVYAGDNPIDEINDVVNTLAMYGGLLSMIGGDSGGGNAFLDILRKKFGHQKIAKIQYVESNYYASWNKKAATFMVNRTRSLDALMMALHRKDFQFPTDEDGSVMEEPFEHILAEHEELVGNQEGIQRKAWRHSASQPDDFLHSLNFAVITMMLVLGTLDLTTSLADADE